MKHMDLFMGRIGRIDSEVRELANGNCVANFSIAETPRIKKGDEWVDGVTIWTEVSIFGDEARNLIRSVKPGTFVMAYTSRSAREYEAKDTKEKKVVQSVVVESIGVAITKFNFIEGIGSVNYKTGETTGSTKSTPKAAPKTTAKSTPKATPKVEAADPFEEENTFGDFGIDSDEEDNPFDVTL